MKDELQMQLQDCINYLTTVAQHEVFQTFSKGLEQFGITPGQSGVLRCLWDQGACTPKELRQIFRLENSTISGMLDRMEKKGLIRRVLDPNDRRSILVEPTEEAMQMRDDVLRVIEEQNAQALSMIPAKNRKVFLESLALIGRVESGSQT